MIDRPIGQPFTSNGVEIVAVKETHSTGSCKNCYYLLHNCHFIPCRQSDREDRTEVLFVTTDQYLLMRAKGQA